MDVSTEVTVDNLTEVTQVVRRSDSLFGVEVPDGWQQGRGAFGGIVLASMYRAVAEAEPDSARTLRSLTAVICGPSMPGPADIQVDVVRAGSGVSTMRAKLTQDAEVKAELTAVMGKPRPIEHKFQATPAPPPADWRDAAIVPIGPPFAPVFARNFEFRPTSGVPFSGASEAIATGWIRPKSSAPQLGIAELIALADAWWPAGLAMEDGPRPIGTIAFTFQPADLPASGLPSDQPLYHHAVVLSAQQGFVVEQRQLLTLAGQCVARNQQTLVWIR